MFYRRFLAAAFLFALLALPASASMVSLLLVETGLGEETDSVPYGSLWEGGLLAAFFDAGHIVTNSPISRMEKKPAVDLTGVVRDDFNEAVTGGADFFVLGFLEFTIRGEKAVPVGIALKIYRAGSGELVGERRFPAGTGKDFEEEYRNAQNAGRSIVSYIRN